MRKQFLVLSLALTILVMGFGYMAVPESLAQACPDPNPDESSCDSLDPTTYNAACCYIFQTSTSNVAEARDLYDIFRGVGGFLLVAAAIIAGIVIIVSGVVWMAAGSNTARVGTAKAIFKNGIIGAVIIFAAGTIIQTIVALATNPLDFFG